MTETVRKWLAAAVLTVWGATLAYVYFSGRVLSYLHPNFQLWTGVSGVVLLLMAGGILFLPAAEHHHCGDDCGHDHDHGTPWGRIFGAGILVIPLLVATSISPSQFSAEIVQNRGYVDDISKLPGYQQPYVEPALPTQDGSVAAGGEAADPGDYLEKNAAGQIKTQTVDLLYAAQEPAMREDFENKEVEVIGQYMPATSNNPKGDRFNLVRMFVVCCAADSRPVAVTVQAARPEKFAEMSWVKVTGKATFPLEGGRRMPVVVADDVTVCDPPKETFIY